MEKWFLYRVYKQDKRLFIVFILFLSGTLITNFLGWQATPFFVWGMYSEKEDTSRYHPVEKVTVNDSIVLNITRYTDANKFFLTSPLQLYIRMKTSGEDPTRSFLKRKLKNNYSAIQNMGQKVLNGSSEYISFVPWYKRCLQQTTGIKVHSYKIELLKVEYTQLHTMKVYSTELIDTWKQ